MNELNSKNYIFSLHYTLFILTDLEANTLTENIVLSIL